MGPEPEHGHPTHVRYGTGLFWVSRVVLLGGGAALASRSPVLGGVFIALGGSALAALIQAKRIGERALVIDDEGIGHTGLWGTHYRVPWSEVSGARAGEYGVRVELRAPRAEFRMPPRDIRRKSGHGSLFLRSLAISGESLVELIEHHLLDAGDVQELTRRA